MEVICISSLQKTRNFVIPVILVGVEEKLPPGSSLKNIFINLWGERISAVLLEMRKNLREFYWKYEKRWQQNSGDEAKALLEEIARNLLEIAIDIKKYKLTCLDLVEEEVKSSFLKLHEDLQS